MSLALPRGLCHTEDAISNVSSNSRSLMGGKEWRNGLYLRLCLRIRLRPAMRGHVVHELGFRTALYLARPTVGGYSESVNGSGTAPTVG